MKRGQGSHEIIVIVGILLVASAFIISEISISSASVARDRTKKSMETLADTIHRVQVQGASATEYVDVFLPPDVDAQHTGKSEVNTLVVAMQDGSEIVVPVQGCIIGKLPNTPGTHTVAVKGGECASLGAQEFSVSPELIMQQLRVESTALQPITIQTTSPVYVRLTTEGGIKGHVDLNASTSAVDNYVVVNAPSTTMLILIAGPNPGTYEGYINVESPTSTARITVKLEVYTNEIEVQTFSDASRTTPSSSFDVNKGLYYRVYIRRAGELSEGKLQIELWHPEGIPVNPYPASDIAVPTGIYEGYFQVKNNLYNSITPVSWLGTYKLKVTDVDSGTPPQETPVQGTGATWLTMSPESVDRWMRPSTEADLPLAFQASGPMDVTLVVSEPLRPYIDVDPSTGDYDAVKILQVGESQSIFDAKIKIPAGATLGTYTGTITASAADVPNEVLQVKLTLYTDDLAWKIEFQNLGSQAGVWSGQGDLEFDVTKINYGETWKFTKTTNCAGSGDGYCSPSQAYSSGVQTKCTPIVDATWINNGFNDASWSDITFPAYSDDYNSVGNWKCTDCLGFFRKKFTLTQEDKNTITSLSVNFKPDEGARCWVNGQSVGSETTCQGHKWPLEQTWTITKAANPTFFNSLVVGENVLTCQDMERKKYSETQFKYFDAKMSIHKLVPAPSPTANITFKVLDQQGNALTGLPITAELRKMSGSDANMDNPKGKYITINEASGTYTAVFSPKAIGQAGPGGSGTYILQFSTEYKSLPLKRGVTFNINDAASPLIHWYFDEAYPTNVRVEPSTPVDLQFALLAQDGSLLSGRTLDMTVRNLDTGDVINCGIMDDGQYYHCQQSGSALNLNPGHYYAEASYSPNGAAKVLSHAFTFNVAAT